MKKTFLITLTLLLCSASVAFGYVYGGSNFNYSGYPEFKAYLSYNPSADEVNTYIKKANEYIENGDNDIRRINEAQDEAYHKAKKALDNYKRNNNKW